MRDALDELQQLRSAPAFETRRRKQAGPVVANSDALHRHGAYVGYGSNDAGQQFVAIYRDGRRLTNWARI